ncbi:MAG: tetratricopeptide repeat protein [Bacteroidota bacterium]
MRIILIVIILLSVSAVHAQTDTDLQLAQHYYTNGEFDKALTYYEKLYAKDPSRVNFTRYYECLNFTGEIKEAEKLIKRQIAANRSEQDYKVMLGQFYEEQKDPDKAQKIYDELIDEISPDASRIIALYNAFKGRGRNDLAMTTIEKGRKLLKNSYPLHFQFADLYGATGQTEKMISEYLDLLDYNQGYSVSIQNVLSKQFDLSNENSREYELLKKSLLERTQKQADKTVYAEMLIWLFTQRKNFGAAITQAQSLDKRLNEQGQRVFDLGKISVENKDYPSARKAFEYVIGLGESSPFYYAAENALLNTRYLEVTTSRNFSQEELQTTVEAYRSKLEKLGRKRNTLPLIIEMSHIQAFYANQAVEAITHLNDALKIQGLTDMQRAELKTKLADIHVLHGDIWEASLLYMQVEADFKFEPIGHEAKFKNARIFYYDGEFDFAQSQLSVLKESTSKLIANDALKLSIMITDNFGLDSNFQAMYWFAQGDLLVEQHRYKEAFTLFDSIAVTYPYHSLGDEILLKKAEAMEQQGNWQGSITYLEELLKYYGEDILADDALFRLGDIFENFLNDKERAAEYYKRILFDYKGSLYTEEARKRFRSLRGDNTEES